MVAEWIILLLEAVKVEHHQGGDASKLWEDALFLRWTQSSTDDCVLATRAAILSNVGSTAIDEVKQEEVIDCTDFQISLESSATESGGLGGFSITIT